jgi:hypothetical protein
MAELRSERPLDEGERERGLGMFSNVMRVPLRSTDEFGVLLDSH